MIPYSPFDKPLKQLEPGDLAALTEAFEGWYIEYKREVPNARSIAKSISAFANTYGGWLFYGIQEKSKEEPVAASFPGIARAEVDPALQRMRQAVATLVAPSPHFDHKVVWGPCDAIGLAANHGVICVHLPYSVATPHVHIDGRIYRRVADGSEPRPENDRFVLDQLWRRADSLRQDYEEWVERDIEFSQAEAEQPYVRLLLVRDPWRQRHFRAELSLEDVRSLMGASKDVPTRTPFDTVYTSATGFVARQLVNNDPHNLGLTWRLDEDLGSEVLIPLNHHYVESPELARQILSGYEGAVRFSQLLVKHSYQAPRIIDCNLLFDILLGAGEIQDRLHGRVGWTEGYFFKAQVLNVWRTCPFVDVGRVLSEFEAHGLPICLETTVTCPPGSGPESFAKMYIPESISSEYARPLWQAAHLFGPIARAFGFPGWIKQEPESEEPFYYEELQQACQRALAIQRKHKERAR